MKKLNDKFKEECGVVGISSRDEAPLGEELVSALLALQHRGQDGAGIFVNAERGLCVKNVGLAQEIFADGLNVNAKTGIGHVRYATFGNKRDVNNVQPVCCNFNGRSIWFAHNGHVVNCDELNNILKQNRYKNVGTTDSEVISALFCLYYTGDIVSTVKILQELIVGAYSITAIYNGQLFCFKDPCGIRPLVVGRTGNQAVVASETTALDALQAEMLFELDAGEIVVFNGDKAERFAGVSNVKRFCSMEYVYFSAPESRYEGKSVAQCRKTIADWFVKEFAVKADCILGVPDTAIPYAKELSLKTGIPYYGLQDDENFPQRSFIKPTQKLRSVTAKSKLDFIDENLFGKSVVVVDDSIVRGTTAKKVVEELKKVGVKEIHFAIMSPQVSNPCWMGLDIATKNELLCGFNQNAEDIARKLGADTVRFLSLDAMRKALGTDELCCACFDGKYPSGIAKCKGTRKDEYN